MGEFSKAIPDQRAGIQIGELFPQLAKQADKYSLIRSMTHRNNGHETAAYLMQTGHTPGERLAYPSIGAVFALFKGPDYKGMIPPYVVLTQPQGRFSEEGFLGPKFKPFATGGDPNAARFEVEGVVARGITDERQKARRELLGKMNTMGTPMAASPQLAAAEDAKKAAYDLILGSGKRGLRPLQGEAASCATVTAATPSGRSAWWRGGWSKAGVPYVVINYPGGWDTHSNHFTTMRRQCPQLDQGLATLLADLKDHGLLESTLVWCCGEFGRRPEDRLAAALERRPQPLRQRLQRAGGRRRVQGRPRRRRVGRQGRGGQGAAGLSGGPAGEHLPAWPASTPAPGCRIPWAWRPTCCPTPSEGVKSAGLLTEIM